MEIKKDKFKVPSIEENRIIPKGEEYCSALGKKNSLSDDEIGMIKKYVDTLSIAEKTDLITGLKKTKAKDFKIGIALGGGGGKTYPEAEVLMQLENLGIKPDVLSGTSQGGVFALRYASDGCSAKNLKKWILDSKINDWYWFASKISKSLKVLTNDNEGKTVTLGTKFEGKKVCDLPIKVKIAMTDSKSYKTHLADTELISDACCGTSRVPYLFDPLKINDKEYVDGCVARNVPFDVFKKDEVDFVLAIDCIPVKPLPTGIYTAIWNDYVYENDQLRKKELSSSYDIYMDIKTRNLQCGFTKLAKERGFEEGRKAFETYKDKILSSLLKKMIFWTKERQKERDEDQTLQ